MPQKFDQFELPQLIVIIELIDSVELQAKGHEEELEELYQYAIENVPQNVPQDWRNAMKEQGKEIPGTVTQLLKQIRKHIVVKIGQVYIK
ncbi:CIC11C00000001891 [Sungouiella intermedia]|uniref:CIC11C00000001891 n=1 Tax=Sungouiella intermedia TaxID=45354 RepID=A0A1L0BL10_9ASCO|nr:CIC11C00000001891 [[Candida] intermedia]